MLRLVVLFGARSFGGESRGTRSRLRPGSGTERRSVAANAARVRVPTVRRVVLLGKSLRILAQPGSDLLLSGGNASGQVKCEVYGRGLGSESSSFRRGSHDHWVKRFLRGLDRSMVGAQLAWWSCACRRTSFGGCVYGRADSVPPCGGRQVGEDEA